MAGMFLNFAALARLPLVDATAISFAAPLITVAFAAWFLGERVRIYRWSAVAVGFAGALARLPLVDATALSFAAPLITVAFAAWFLGERVRIYRWSAVAVGFAGIIVMLWPYLNLAQYAAGGSATVAATVGVVCGLTAAFTNAGSVIQTRRLTDTETTSSIVFYFSLFCAIAGLATLPFGWIWPSGMQLSVLIAAGLIGGLAHIVLTSSYRYAPASLVAPLDYTTMIWA